MYHLSASAQNENHSVRVAFDAHDEINSRGSRLSTDFLFSLLPGFSLIIFLVMISVQTSSLFKYERKTQKN